jgi:hypothetical protein
LKGSGRGLILSYYPSIRLEVLGKEAADLTSLNGLSVNHEYEESDKVWNSLVWVTVLYSYYKWKYNT